MSGLTREDIFAIQDIETKEIAVPMWGGKSLFIRQLTRAEQDEYLRRQYGGTKMRQDNRARNQQIDGMNLYGHDAYLCICGICDADGKRLFIKADIEKLAEKNGEAVGYIAKEIIEFSGMAPDVEVLDKTKNLSKTPKDSSSIDLE